MLAILIAADTVFRVLSAASTPAACADTAFSLFKQDLRAESRSAADVKLRANMATCGRRFPVETVTPAQLASATVLYLRGHLDTLLFRAFERSIALATSDSGRAAALSHVLVVLTGNHDFAVTPVWIDRAEAYLARLESMPTASRVSLVRWHHILAKVYAVNDPRRQQHVRRARAIVAALSPVQRGTQEGRTAICAAAELDAEQLASTDHFSAAASALDVCLALRQDATNREERWELLRVRKLRRQYASVGHPVPAPLAAPYWLNVPAGMASVDLTRPVTLVEFTWTGCPECYKGYPALRHLDTTYKGRGYQSLFITYLFGETPQHSPATIEQELAYDRHFWTEDKPMPFPIGVLALPDSAEQAVEPYPSLFKKYAVIGAPTYYLIDRHGMIRYVQSGHTPDLEERLAAAIERLLME